MTEAAPRRVKERIMLKPDDPAWVDLIADTLARHSNNTKEGPMPANEPLDGWQAECEKAVRILSNLLHLAGRRQTGSAVIELLRTAPRTPEEMDKVLTDSLLCRCTKEAFDSARPSDQRMFHEICTYISCLTKMPPSRRSMLEASVAGTFLGWGMGGS